MEKFTILTDKLCLKHYSGSDHPERPSRIYRILNALKRTPNLINYHEMKSEILLKDKDLINNIKNVHSQEHFNKLFKTKDSKNTFFDFDCIANNYTFFSALASAKLTTLASELCTVDHSYFSLIRPPGHHATYSEIMGFCFINNIAVAAHSLVQKNYKVAIIDFDFHYGNGTAEIFWDSPNVLYISIHADPSINFPNSGFITEIGAREGMGFNVCIPFSFASGDNELISAFSTIIFPILEEYKPDYIGISAGFDGYFNDPVGQGFLKYTNKGYNKLGLMIYNFSYTNKIPIFQVLEGGYDISSLPSLFNNYTKSWTIKDTNKTYEKIDYINIRPLHLRQKEKNTLQKVKNILSPFWNIP